ncbi:MAG: septum formation initiator family protein [Eubacteriales bacterium]|nr:septum formation initiator family protein [Eubacteriales bacterium]
MRKTVNIWVLIGSLAVVLIAFFCYSGTLAQTITELNDVYDQGKVRQAELQNEQAELKATLENAGSDSYIESQARSVYGYMMPDEIRLVITNPEVLYGDEGVPSR